MLGECTCWRWGLVASCSREVWPPPSGTYWGQVDGWHKKETNQWCYSIQIISFYYTISRDNILEWEMWLTKQGTESFLSWEMWFFIIGKCGFHLWEIWSSKLEYVLTVFDGFATKWVFSRWRMCLLSLTYNCVALLGSHWNVTLSDGRCGFWLQNVLFFLAKKCGFPDWESLEIFEAL